MSRTGKQPIKILTGTTVTINGDFIIVNGPKGELKQKLVKVLQYNITDGEIKVKPVATNAQSNAMWGLHRTLIQNMVDGVNTGFEKKLEVNGVGYKVSISGDRIILNVGYSHPVEYKLPRTVSASVEANVIKLSSIDKQLVGETAAQIRRIRKPEPYKGKGIKYVDEVIRRKEGKTSAK